MEVDYEIRVAFVLIKYMRTLPSYLVIIVSVNKNLHVKFKTSMTNFP